MEENEELAKSSGREMQDEEELSSSSSENISVLSMSETIQERMTDILPSKSDWILVEEIQTTGLPLYSCRLCGEFISVPYYATKKDDEDNGGEGGGESSSPSSSSSLSSPSSSSSSSPTPFGHKVCVDLPMEMEHQHTPDLHTLHKTARAMFEGNDRFCNSCNEAECTWKVYYKCSDCEDFVLGIKCALRLFPINHERHQHPLIPNHKAIEQFHCFFCNMDGHYGISFECNTCTPPFRVHQYCISPRIVKLATHRHDLRPFYYLPQTHFGEPIYCHICRQDLRGQTLAYHCARCRYFFHVYSCRTFRRSDDDFPLLLIEEEGAGADPDSGFDGSFDCGGCQLKISVPYYLSTSSTDLPCNGLHKFCAELPDTLEHHRHPGHVLTLGKSEQMCDACHGPWEGFSYFCPRASCSFSIDIICASKNVHSQHKFHEHPLIASHTKGLFACHACQATSDGPSYKCTTCRFWVHHQCGSAPMSREHDMHPHQLTLTYSIRESTPEEDNDRKFHCHVCREEMQPHDWAYHCAGCKYYIHAHDCYDPPWSRELEEFDHEAALAAAVRLPAVDSESVSLATLIFMDTSKEDDGRKIGQTLLFHDLNETCHRCEELIADPCNNCALCKYFLPKFLAEFHDPVSLLRGYYSSMLMKDSTNDTNCNGFGMRFSKDGLTMKVSSSVLPRYVKHEGHRHVLLTTFIPEKTWCSACENDFQGYAFKCNLCNFTLDTYCASLPGSIRHGYDKMHPFKLTYYSIEGVEEYVCELCEEDITTMWFYHCVECDQSIHPKCIWRYFICFGDSVSDEDDVLETFLVPTTKTHPIVCCGCGKNKTSGCCYSAFQLSNGIYMKTHLECGGDSKIERWPAEREELASMLALMMTTCEEE